MKKRILALIVAAGIALAAGCAGTMAQGKAEEEEDCVYVAQTGSRLKHRVCHIRKQPTTEKREDQLRMEKIQRETFAPEKARR